ncbi:MAG TPA: 30S ribosomal protein S8 [Candidatus Babeliales bacterium]|jgi:small subunit ribosomal protein S8|nr:30S ribosomal protein S8 [Candidatus Babeliales bacterium]
MDVIANFLTIIRNGVMASKPFVLAPYSKERNAIAAILKKEGFISDVLVVKDTGNSNLKIILKYVDGESVIHEIERVSKPSRRIYTSIHALKPVIGGLGVSILSTNQGLLSHKKAKELNVGGEVICTVW